MSAKATQTRPHELRVQRHFQAPPARVFQAWTSAGELNAWSSPNPVPARATVDLRVGGTYHIVMESPDGTEHVVRGVYREIVPPHRLVYTWRWDTIPGFPETVVTVEFRAASDGGTDLLLVHDDLPSDDARARHEHGWVTSLGNLAAIVR